MVVEDVPKWLVAIAEGGFGRPVAAFAGRAGAFVFRLDRTTGRPTRRALAPRKFRCPARTRPSRHRSPGSPFR
ncbi:hypothetical protein A4U61_04375 [Streptomyces sp. H-KF8]|nr:hypothetical protein A4U61_04375 [Streptomyces sp. H-KF8]